MSLPQKLNPDNLKNTLVEIKFPGSVQFLFACTCAVRVYLHTCFYPITNKFIFVNYFRYIDNQ
jgi:hypothetical protein